MNETARLCSSLKSDSQVQHLRYDLNEREEVRSVRWIYRGDAPHQIQWCVDFELEANSVLKGYKVSIESGNYQVVVWFEHENDTRAKMTRIQCEDRSIGHHYEWSANNSSFEDSSTQWEFTTSYFNDVEDVDDPQTVLTLSRVQNIHVSTI